MHAASLARTRFRKVAAGAPTMRLRRHAHLRDPKPEARASDRAGHGLLTPFKAAALDFGRSHVRFDLA
jgi:hypothetical protein